MVSLKLFGSTHQKKAMEDEKRFKELKSKFFGICFTDGTIQVHVLESVQEHL